MDVCDENRIGELAPQPFFASVYHRFLGESESLVRLVIRKLSGNSEIIYISADISKKQQLSAALKDCPAVNFLDFAACLSECHGLSAPTNNERLKKVEDHSLGVKVDCKALRIVETICLTPFFKVLWASWIGFGAGCHGCHERTSTEVTRSGKLPRGA